jgi:ATP-dependent protease ClpP protease subunit
MQELLLYGGIHSYSAEEFIQKLNEFDGEDITCRINCQGGDVFAGWGMIAKMREYSGSISVKVDGIAASMAAFMLLFADEVECLDASSFIFHRADGYVSSEEDKAWLSSINANFRRKMEEKIPSALFKEVTGKSYNDLFNPDARIDCMLTAKQAKQLGLVTKINKLSVTEAKKVKALADKYNFTAELPKQITSVLELDSKVEPIIETIKMKTIAEFKAAHPELYAQVQQEAIDAERDRVGSFLAFLEIDAVTAKAGIESGKPMTQTQMAQFNLKAMQANTLAKLPTNAVEVTAAVDKTTEQIEADKKKSDFLAEASAGLKVDAAKNSDINVHLSN